MRAKLERHPWIILGVVAALLLSLAVAWSFRDRLSRTSRCAALYDDAATAADSAAIDSIVVVPAGAEAAVTCGDLRE